MHFNNIPSLFILADVAVAAIPSTRTSYNDSNLDLTSSLPPFVPVNSRAENQELITKLLTSATQEDRVALLDQPGDFVFDFSPGAAPPSSETKAREASPCPPHQRRFQCCFVVHRVNHI
ncbi:hypothetical protein E4U53_003520 [Claviceps sorghi]|nr:hypothetical protein E4U53_003520 [Claviceps sorghi]